jgi:thioredoxin reductase
LPDQQFSLAFLTLGFIVDRMDETYEVVVIGGGAAGLSGALTLGRARRRVVVVDAGEPRNAPADGVHGFLTRDGTPPAELVALGRTEVARYGVEIVDGRVVSATRDGDAFAVALADGRSMRARRVLLTTGLVDELPDVPGVAEGWGADVVHCPFCHGWEIREHAIGVLASGPMAVHQALLFRGWTDDLTLLAHTRGLPAAEELEQLAARGIRVVEGEVAAIERRDGRVAGARLADGELVPLEAIAVQPRFVAREDLLAGLGLVAAPHPMGREVGSQIPADATGRTDVPGIWVAGNARDVTASVSGAVETGMRGAGALLADLLAEDTARAMERAAA